MFLHFELLATSLQVGRGLDFGLTNGSGEKPLILINYPAEVLAVLVDRVLKPFAKPDHFFVGINPCGSQFEVTVFAVVPLADATVIADLVGIPLPHPARLILGNNADIPMDGIATFLDAKGRDERFFVGCGYEPSSEFRNRVYGGWTIQLSTIYGSDVRDRFHAALE